MILNSMKDLLNSKKAGTLIDDILETSEEISGEPMVECGSWYNEGIMEDSDLEELLIKMRVTIVDYDVTYEGLVKNIKPQNLDFVKEEIKYALFSDDDSYECILVPYCDIENRFDDEYPNETIFFFNELIELSNIEELVFNDKDKKITINLSSIRKLNGTWESLLFSENTNNFILIEDIINNKLLELTTNGSVRITNLSNQEVLTNKDGDEIRSLVNNRDIYDSEKYFIDENNWFEIYYGENSLSETPAGSEKNPNYYDGEVFESTPKTMLALIHTIKEIFDEYLSFEEK